MDDSSLGSIVPLTALIALHALIVLAYAALTNSRERALREQTEYSMETPPRLHITYQVSLLLIRFLIAALAAAGLGAGLIALLPIENPDLDRLTAYTLALVPAALLTLILGDLVPESIGSARATALAPWARRFMRVMIVLFSPVVTLMIALSRWLAGIFGSRELVNVFTEEEIMTMLDASEKEGAIEEEEKEMIYSVLEFGDTLAREVMVPRIDIVALEIDTLLDEALKVLIDSGHSRVPVYENNIDNIKGLLYAKDLLPFLRTDAPAKKPIREIIRKAYFVPESKRADELLEELQASKIHIAIVVDEYGGTAGLVTIEDLIEEIVGDIQDEYDVHEEAEYEQHGPNVFVVEAGMNLEDFNDLVEAKLSTEDSDTLGGYLFTHFGRVPEAGETLAVENLTLRIDTIEGRRIRKVHVTRHVPPPVSDAEAEGKAGNNVNQHPQPITE